MTLTPDELEALVGKRLAPTIRELENANIRIGVFMHQQVGLRETLALAKGLIVEINAALVADKMDTFPIGDWKFRAQELFLK